jgi:probable rRNA maturation factor
MHKITIQRMVPKDTMPAQSLLKKWAKKALESKTSPAELNIRIVDIAEITELNSHYRHKSGPTNVLSFPFDMPEEAQEELLVLGDIVICAAIVNQEAQAQDKTQTAHWAHMVVHGTLHLLGYDHETDADAAIMELKEITILSTLGFNNPYQLLEKGTQK